MGEYFRTSLYNGSHFSADTEKHYSSHNYHVNNNEDNWSNIPNTWHFNFRHKFPSIFTISLVFYFLCIYSSSRSICTHFVYWYKMMLLISILCWILIVLFGSILNHVSTVANKHTNILWYVNELCLF